jgi:hypothetical protein
MHLKLCISPALITRMSPPPRLERLSLDRIEAAALLDELHLVVRMAMRPRPAPRLSIEQKDGDAGVPLVGPDEAVRAAAVGQILVSNAVHGKIPGCSKSVNES